MRISSCKYFFTEAAVFKPLRYDEDYTFLEIYAPNGFLYFRGEFTFFNAGPYLKAVGTGKDILFTGVTAQLKL
jgi:hypothetical protein